MSRNRGRLGFAAAATVALVAAVVVVAVSGGSDEDGGAGDPCLTEWNDDAIARSDGVHAFEVHRYGATFVTRVDPQGNVLADASGAPTAEARCAVVFASPVVDSEPDFGVRVLDQGRWAGLALVEKVPLDRIEAMQSEATATANATLLPDGRLAAD
jgi:hypothetical protein